MNWLYVILAGLGGGVLSLLLGMLLLRGKKEKSIMSYITAFAAGVLLATTFLHIVPESLEGGVEIFGEESSSFIIMLFLILGIVICFILKAFLHRFHSHAHPDDCEECEHHEAPLMITISDTIHNFLDGITIAAGFLVSPMTGLIVTICIIAHEIPQEMGDIAIMRMSGVSKKKTIWLNIFSSFASLIAAVVFYAIGTNVELPIAPISALVGGFFIYIAASDIIPTLQKSQNSKKTIILKIVLLLLGIIVMALLIWFLHPYMEVGHEH